MCAQVMARITEAHELFARLTRGDVLTNGRLIMDRQAVFYFVSDGAEVDTQLTYRLENVSDDLRRDSFTWSLRRVDILHFAGDKPSMKDRQKVIEHLERERQRRRSL